ncbi:MAG: thioredoxin domain-containing protein [Betaproteobacteria bacterium]|nr:thioredoxin domain-containing protein [Betaproteobacteria bacterium]
MSNRLAGATSPYLQQHADNPVDWYPWGEEALAKARAEDKPILLSVGYSACHWCHVMAHESFEDPAVAAAMNDAFVNVKVDREERPDLDQIYQTAHALLTRRSGGWPLTMFLTPDGAPFFGGTYFPKHGRYGLPGFLDLLPQVAAAYREQRDALAEQSARLAEALATLEPEGGAAAWPYEAPAHALAGLKRTFDPVHGGFGAAPKFPHPAELDYCLHAYAQRGDAEALAIVRTTLDRMADGGIHDQLGGGFCRYSVDAQWSIPHFEKMLYDNGPLLALYADLARVTGERRYADVARDIVGWLVREMRAPDGAYYSSLDADSEGHEGKFYVWTRDEAQAATSADEFAVASPYYGLDLPPNFEGHAWNLRVSEPLDAIAARLAISLPDAQTRLAGARAALFAARANRVRPGRDDKILTSWNALAIAGLARASRALDEPRWADLAFAAADALERTAWRDGRLSATRRGERADLNAYLDDHAFLLAALVELMQTRFRRADFDWAREIADVLLARFEDRERGGFWFTSHDHERLFHRTKPGHDNATPSGNGVAAHALAVFGHLAGDLRYVETARRTVELYAPMLAESPGGYSSLLTAMAALESPPASVLLAGAADDCAAWQRTLEATYRPHVRVLNLAQCTDVPPALAKGAAPASGAQAWVCRGTTCLPPMVSILDVADALAPEGARLR